MALRAAVPAFAAMLVGTAPAQAAAPWSEPASVRGAANAFPRVVFGTGGHGTAIWRTAGSTYGAAVQPQEGFGPAYRLASRFVSHGGAAVGPTGGLAVVGTVPYRPRGARRAQGSRSAVAHGRVGGRLGRPRPLMPPLGNGSVDAASNAAGDLAVVGWASRSSPARSARRWIHVAVRRAGGRFSRPQRIARYPKRGRSPSLAVAIDGARRVVVAWAAHGRIYTRTRSAGGRLATAQPIGRSEQPAIDWEPSVEAHAGPGGHDAIGWSDQPLPGESPITDPGVIKVASRAAGTRLFGPPVELERVTPRTGPNGELGAGGVATPPRMAALGPGRVLLSWDGQEGDRPVVRAAELRGTAVGPRETLRRPGQAADAGRLAAGPRGEAVVVWLESQEDPRRDLRSGAPAAIVAAVRPPGAPGFAAPEEVVTGLDLGGPQLAVDPVTRRPIALWSRLDRGPDGIPVGSSSLHSAARAPVD